MSGVVLGLLKAALVPLLSGALGWLTRHLFPVTTSAWETVAITSGVWVLLDAALVVALRVHL